MKVVIRADASVAIGTGHVMRCRTLAATLKKQGVDIHFVTRAHSGHLTDLLLQDGFTVTTLPPPKSIEKNANTYSGWLGVSQRQDAVETIAAIENQPCDWLIVDHYGLDNSWEEVLKPYTRKLMVIDDLANRRHECDFLLDQNYVANHKDRYRTLVPKSCQLLLGPRYALLHPEYAMHQKAKSSCKSDIKRILVFMGGSDKSNITGKVLTALQAKDFASIDIDVVIGENHCFKSHIIEWGKLRSNIHIHMSLPHLADLMSMADLAIGAGGATTWERICLGLPSLVLSVADNQEPICEALDSAGLIRYLGSADEVDVHAIKLALSEIISDTRYQENLRPRLKALVDGLGVNRIAEVLKPSSSKDLVLRQANSSDALTYFSWANDAEVRSMAFNTDPIELNTHMLWFENHLLDESTYLYILEAGTLPVGQIRFELQDGEAMIDYSLDEFIRGRGWAKQLLKLGIFTLYSHKKITLKAIVKQNNIASSAAFLALGFLEQKMQNESATRHFKLHLTTSEIMAQQNEAGI